MKKNNKGFSLVELIVVIAIMAILAAVAVVGVSVYIPKAQKANDEQLAADIKYALNLAAEVGELTDGDFIVIKYDGTAEYGNSKGGDGATANNAMIAVFGNDWQNELKLAYSEWELGVVADNEMMGYVSGSTFDANPEVMKEMLSGVSTATGIMSELYASGSVELSDEMKAFLEENHISDSKENATAVSNATVLFVAGNISSELSGSEDNFAKVWHSSFSGGRITLPDFESVLDDDLSKPSAQLAFAEAVASYFDAALNNGGTYVGMLRTAKGSGSKSALKTAMESVVSDINTKMASDEAVLLAAMNYYGVTADPDGNPIEAPAESTRAYQDAMAFLAYMQGITEASDSMIANTDLSKEDYYTDGTVLNYATDYVNLSGALNGEDDAFAFYYNEQSGTISCVPLDY